MNADCLLGVDYKAKEVRIESEMVKLQVFFLPLFQIIFFPDLGYSWTRKISFNDFSFL
jgi:hypothetical protein